MSLVTSNKSKCKATCFMQSALVSEPLEDSVMFGTRSSLLCRMNLYPDRYHSLRTTPPQ